MGKQNMQLFGKPYIFKNQIRNINKYSIFIIIILVMLMSSCMSSMIPLAKRAKGPLFTKAPESLANEAILYIYRPYASTGAAVEFPFLIDNKEIVALKCDGYTWIYLQEGEYHIKMALKSGIELVTTLQAEPGKNYYLKVSTKTKIKGILLKMIHSFQIDWIEEEDALQEITKTHFQENSYQVITE